MVSDEFRDLRLSSAQPPLDGVAADDDGGGTATIRSPRQQHPLDGFEFDEAERTQQFRYRVGCREVRVDRVGVVSGAAHQRRRERSELRIDRETGEVAELPCASTDNTARPNRPDGADDGAAGDERDTNRTGGPPSAERCRKVGSLDAA